MTVVCNVFEHIEHSQEKQFLLRVSYMEIYNENVHDLLAEKEDRTKNLKFRCVHTRNVGYNSDKGRSKTWSFRDWGRIH